MLPGLRKPSSLSARSRVRRHLRLRHWPPPFPAAGRCGGHHSSSSSLSDASFLGPLWAGLCVQAEVGVGGEGRRVSLPLEVLANHPPGGVAPALEPLTVCPRASQSSAQAEESYKMQIPGPVPNLLNHSLRAGVLESVFLQSVELCPRSQH